MTLDELAAEEREARRYLNAVRRAMGSYGQRWGWRETPLSQRRREQQLPLDTQDADRADTQERAG